MDCGQTTYFAPAERIHGSQLQAQVDYFAHNVILVRILNFMPYHVVILNSHRQAVFVNDAMLNALGLSKPDEVLGLRPGEIFHCEHSQETPGGCGTSRFCRYCGAVNAIMNSQRLQEMVESDCALTNFELATIDLRVSAVPCDFEDGQYYTLLLMRDISDTKRRSILERVFFHDIRNMLGGLCLVAQRELRKPDDKSQEVGRYLGKLSDEIVDEINAQQELLSAEDGNLVTEWQEVVTSDLVNSVVYLMRNSPVAEGKQIEVPADSAVDTIVTDSRLLRRVLVNMTKNALEASRKGDVVTVSARRSGDWIDFCVHNTAYIPEDTQMQLFRRSFSTKGTGRGIGTYSMKLLTEKYLHGKIVFTSDPDQGTVFTASYPLER